ncbi:MAG: dihydrofolate reductase [Ferruginibacter sp.]|nr:dihydrofolate reductase [Chitinophagaceae bacterium]
MGKLVVYNFVSLNGCFKGPNEDISWAKSGSNEEKEFAAGNLQSGNILLFGRVTYEMMAGYWPTAAALKNDPIVAEGMNTAEKIVFSRTLKKAEWNHTRIVRDKMEEEIKKLKQVAGKDMTLLGSGSIVTQLTEMGLVDEYQVMVHPVAIGGGTPLLKDIHQKLDLVLINTKTFKSGVVLLSYSPKEK